jgi:hypothetical protein
MLIKSKDEIAPQLTEFNELLRLKLTTSQRAAIEREIAIMQAGFRAERDAAYQIDFRLKDHKEWVVIHDLRLEHNGRVAQIDHLILHPNWEFYVVETKGIRTKLKIENGEWAFLQNNHWRGMASPVEQNARHVQVLKELLRDSGWLPRTLGIPVVPRFINVVLVPPDCLIRRNEELTWVLHMDDFVTKALWDFNIGGAILNLIHMHSGKDAVRVGQQLVSAHRPFTIDYRERFGISPPPSKEPKELEHPSGRHCESCEEPISNAAAYYCRIHKDRFAGRMLCRKCQQYASAETKTVTAAPPANPPKVTVVAAKHCDECGAEVDSKVVAFCRFNSKKFAKRVLCRKCQVSVGNVSGLSLTAS